MEVRPIGRLFWDKGTSILGSVLVSLRFSVTGWNHLKLFVDLSLTHVNYNFFNMAICIAFLLEFFLQSCRWLWWDGLISENSVVRWMVWSGNSRVLIWKSANFTLLELIYNHWLLRSRFFRKIPITFWVMWILVSATSVSVLCCHCHWVYYGVYIRKAF